MPYPRPRAEVLSRMSARKRARFAAGEIDVDEQNPRLLHPSGLKEGVKGMTDHLGDVCVVATNLWVYVVFVYGGQGRGKNRD